MGFIESYKQLEKICGELLNDERRLSAYIDAMINTRDGSYLVEGWDEDLKQLKRYRWIRNHIVHEPGCSEDNMCKPYDTMWLDNFYFRIMSQDDPLALYRKATTTPHVKKTTHPHTSKPKTCTHAQQNKSKHRKRQKHDGCLIFAVAVFTVAVILLLVLLSTNNFFADV